jgi:hypothetical protein
VPVDDLDLAAMIADEAGLLQHMGDHRHRGAAHAQHLRKEFVGEPDRVALKPVARLQQPAAQPCFDVVQGVAGGGLLHLHQQHLAIAHDDLANRFAVLGGLAKTRRRDARGRARYLNDGARLGAARSKSRQRADRAFVTDRRDLDRVALLHHGEQRDDPVVRKIDLVDALALLLQDHPLLEGDVLQVRREQHLIFGGQALQKQISPAHVGAIQLHRSPSVRSEPGPHNRTRSDDASVRSGERYATGMEGCLCGIRQEVLRRGRLAKVRPQHR